MMWVLSQTKFNYQNKIVNFAELFLHSIIQFYSVKVKHN